MSWHRKTRKEKDEYAAYKRDHDGRLGYTPSEERRKKTPTAGYVLLPDSYLAPLREIVRKRMHDLEVQVKIDGRQCTLSLPEIMRRGSHMIYVFKGTTNLLQPGNTFTTNLRPKPEWVKYLKHKTRTWTHIYPEPFANQFYQGRLIEASMSELQEYDKAGYFAVVPWLIRFEGVPARGFGLGSEDLAMQTLAEMAQGLGLVNWREYLVNTRLDQQHSFRASTRSNMSAWGQGMGIILTDQRMVEEQCKRLERHYKRIEPVFATPGQRVPSYASYTGQCRGEDSSSSGGESADDEDSSSSSSSSSGESEDEEDGGGVEVGGGQEPDGRSEGGQSSMGGGGSAGGGSAGDAEDCVMDWATGLYRISPVAQRRIVDEALEAAGKPIVTRAPLTGAGVYKDPGGKRWGVDASRPGCQEEGCAMMAQRDKDGQSHWCTRHQATHGVHPKGKTPSEIHPKRTLAPGDTARRSTRLRGIK